MAYARQETGIPFLFKVASKMIKKEIMHARTGGAAAVISKFKGEKKSLLIRDFAVQSGGSNFCF